MKNVNLKNDIKRVNPEVLINRGYARSADISGVVCPHCGNGSGEDGSQTISATISSKIFRKSLLKVQPCSARRQVLILNITTSRRRKILTPSISTTIKRRKNRLLTIRNFCRLLKIISSTCLPLLIAV